MKFKLDALKVPAVQALLARKYKFIGTDKNKAVNLSDKRQRNYTLNKETIHQAENLPTLKQLCNLLNK